MLKTFKPYTFLIAIIALLSLASNGLSLYFPKKMGEYVDLYKNGGTNVSGPMWYLIGIAALVLIFALLQGAIAAYASEKVAYDLRNKLIAALKTRSFKYIRGVTGGKLITVLTSDVDAVKNLVAQGIVSLLMAVITLIGAIIFLLTINWRLALLTLSIIPFILLFFFLIFGRMGALFGASQANQDAINSTTNESIIGSGLIRVLNAIGFEVRKFDVVNKKGTEISIGIVKLFSALIPIITLLSNVSILIVLWFGGNSVANGTLTLGQMSAFFAYTSVFIWPFFILSFASTFISMAQVSLGRINGVLEGEKLEEMIPVTDPKDMKKLEGHIVFKNVTLKYGDKAVLKNISFEIQPHTRTAILGPTGAGKTELFYLMVGLAKPDEGEILIDGKSVDKWNQSELLSQIGMVFQDSIVFNASLKENVLFKIDTKDQNLDEKLNKVLNAAELGGLVKELPQGVETNVSERGTTLSGGQKQRLTLARALSIQPSVLLLDDFTARVDAGTEERILGNIKETFPNITLISITQKVEPIKSYDHIIVLMEGELIASGKHQQLLLDSIDYQQIYESQKSTEEDAPVASEPQK